MLCVTYIIIDNSFIGSTHDMSNKTTTKTLPSDPEFLLQYMDDIGSDYSDEGFDGYVEENESCSVSVGDVRTYAYWMWAL